MSTQAEVPGESGRATGDLSEGSSSLPGVFIPDDKLTECEEAIRVLEAVAPLDFECFRFRLGAASVDEDQSRTHGSTRAVPRLA